MSGRPSALFDPLGSGESPIVEVPFGAYPAGLAWCTWWAARVLPAPSFPSPVPRWVCTTEIIFRKKINHF